MAIKEDKIEEYLNSKDFKRGKDIFEPIENKIKEILNTFDEEIKDDIDRAIERAEANGRKVIKAFDF